MGPTMHLNQPTGRPFPVSQERSLRLLTFLIHVGGGSITFPKPRTAEFADLAVDHERTDFMAPRLLSPLQTNSRVPGSCSPGALAPFSAGVFSRCLLRGPSLERHGRVPCAGSAFSCGFSCSWWGCLFWGWFRLIRSCTPIEASPFPWPDSPCLRGGMGYLPLL